MRNLIFLGREPILCKPETCSLKGWKLNETNFHRLFLNLREILKELIYHVKKKQLFESWQYLWFYFTFLCKIQIKLSFKFLLKNSTWSQCCKWSPPSVLPSFLCVHRERLKNKVCRQSIGDPGYFSVVGFWMISFFLSYTPLSLLNLYNQHEFFI